MWEPASGLLSAGEASRDWETEELTSPDEPHPRYPRQRFPAHSPTSNPTSKAGGRAILLRAESSTWPRPPRPVRSCVHSK